MFSCLPEDIQDLILSFSNPYEEFHKEVLSENFRYIINRQSPLKQEYYHYITYHPASYELMEYVDNSSSDGYDSDVDEDDIRWDDRDFYSCKCDNKKFFCPNYFTAFYHLDINAFFEEHFQSKRHKEYEGLIIKIKYLGKES